MFPTLEELESKRLNLESKLSDSALIANQREYKKVAREHAQVSKLAVLVESYQKVNDELAENNPASPDTHVPGRIDTSLSQMLFLLRFQPSGYPGLHR